MIAAEKWYEHSERYRKYGLSMKPEANVQKKKRKEGTEASKAMSPKEKAAVLFIIVLIGTVFLGMIITTAYCAKIKYEINAIEKQNSVITGEIENLHVEIKSASNIQTVEDIAKNQLGMVYPATKDIVYLTGTINVETSNVQDFLLAMKERAYTY